MTPHFDMSDVPAVTSDEMWQIVELLIDSGLIESLPNRLSERQLDQLWGQFWANYKGSGTRGLAISHRFMALLDFLGSKRLEPQLRARKWQIVAASVGVAATLRLNPKWGFNRMKLAALLDAELETGEFAMADAMTQEHALLDLIAPLQTTSVASHAEVDSCDEDVVLEAGFAHIIGNQPAINSSIGTLQS